MTTLKSLMIVGALLVGTTSLAMAQAEGTSGPDGQLALRPLALLIIPQR